MWTSTVILYVVYVCEFLTNPLIMASTFAHVQWGNALNWGPVSKSQVKCGVLFSLCPQFPCMSLSLPPWLHPFTWFAKVDIKHSKAQSDWLHFFKCNALMSTQFIAVFTTCIGHVYRDDNIMFKSCETIAPISSPRVPSQVACTLSSRSLIGHWVSRKKRKWFPSWMSTAFPPTFVLSFCLI